MYANWFSLQSNVTSGNYLKNTKPFMPELCSLLTTNNVKCDHLQSWLWLNYESANSQKWCNTKISVSRSRKSDMGHQILPSTRTASGHSNYLENWANWNYGHYWLLAENHIGTCQYQSHMIIIKRRSQWFKWNHKMPIDEYKSHARSVWLLHLFILDLQWHQEVILLYLCTLKNQTTFKHTGMYESNWNS